MENPASQSFFNRCGSILSGNSQSETSSSELDFLRSIGYLDDCADQTEYQNRIAVLKLLSRLDDVFQLPAKEATGGYFFGGLVSPDVFGLDAHGDGPIGIGGRGENMRQAVESCAGEAAELVSFLRQANDPRVTARQERPTLSARDGKWASSYLFPEDSSRIGHYGWIKATTLVCGSEITVPADLVLRRAKTAFMEPCFTESNGVGAGATRDQAIASGFFEVVERDAVLLWWYGGNLGRKIPTYFLEQIDFMQFAQKIRPNSPRKWWILDVTPDHGITSIVAVSCEHDGRGVVIGCASGPTLLTAAKSAFLEMSQMEITMEISLWRKRHKPEFELTDVDLQWIDCFERLNLNNYPTLMGKANFLPPALKMDLGIEVYIQKLADKNYNTYSIDLTRKDIGIPIQRIIISNLQSSRIRFITDRLKTVAISNNVDLSDTLKNPKIF